MRTTRPLLLLLACLAFPAALPAQQSSSTPLASPPTSDPQAVTVVQRALSALTGGATISDVTLTGTASRVVGSDDETGTVTLTAMSPAYSKLALEFPSGPQTEIRNPATTPLPGTVSTEGPASAQGPQPVGAWSGPDGAIKPMAADNLLTDPTWFFPAFTLARIISAPYVLSYVGEELYNGQQAIHVVAEQAVLNVTGQSPVVLPLLIQHLSHADLYFDPTTFLPIALVFSIHPDANVFVDIPTSIQFSNYQEVTTAAVPLRVQKYLNGALNLDLQLGDVALNSGLNPSAFQIP